VVLTMTYRDLKTTATTIIISTIER